MGAVGAAQPSRGNTAATGDSGRARSRQRLDVCLDTAPSAIPKDLPPRSTVYDYFDLWSWDGTLDRIHEALYRRCREEASREASPTAAIIDSQSVKSAEKGDRIDPRGYDAGKKIKGKKRHVLVDTQGLLMHAIVHSADIQDRDGGALLIAHSTEAERPFHGKLSSHSARS